MLVILFPITAGCLGQIRHSCPVVSIDSADIRVYFRQRRRTYLVFSPFAVSFRYFSVGHHGPVIYATYPLH